MGYAEKSKHLKDRIFSNENPEFDVRYYTDVRNEK
jgi:hypothetical protein